MPIAIRYYRSLPNRIIGGYALGIFLVFGAVGFVGDLSRGPMQRPWETMPLLVSIFASGGVGVLFALAPMRSWWFLPFAIAGMFLGLGGVDLVWRARAASWAAHPADLAAVQHRLLWDGRGATVSIVLGFVLMVRFIRSEGVRQTRLRAEMDLAREIHESLVPAISLSASRCEVRGRSSPSSDVGGDLVDAFEREGRLVACVADVSGHGVSAGTLMAMVRSALRLQLAARERLETLLADLDRLLLDLGRPDRFVTLACVRFDEAGGADYALAGHLPILRIRAGAVTRLENTNPPLGVRAGQPFDAGRTAVAAGDLLAIFTDGLSEVRDAAGHEFGIERLEALLASHASRPLAEIEQLVFDAVRSHGPQLDDQTLLLLRVR